MPTTWALPPANRPCRAFSAGASALQVAVKANAKKASTTRWPRRASSEICLPSWAGSSNAGARSPTCSVAVRVASFVRPFGRGSAADFAVVFGSCCIDLDYGAVKVDVAKRRVRADRADFLDSLVGCPFCGTKVGPRHVTREHLDVPPNPPYAASVICPQDQEQFEVVFTG